MRSLAATGDRIGAFSLPVKVVMAIVLVFVLVALVLVILQPKSLQFSDSANQTMFGTIKDIGEVFA